MGMPLNLMSKSKRLIAKSASTSTLSELTLMVAGNEISLFVDLAKLAAYRDQLDYLHAAFVILPSGNRPGAPIQWVCLE